MLFLPVKLLTLSHTCSLSSSVPSTVKGSSYAPNVQDEVFLLVVVIIIQNAAEEEIKIFSIKNNI